MAGGRAQRWRAHKWDALNGGYPFRGSSSLQAPESTSESGGLATKISIEDRETEACKAEHVHNQETGNVNMKGFHIVLDRP